ncbi:uncharacterized protein BDR25DRAFT_306220, partial [Lindgomyces ingoldianus]
MRLCETLTLAYSPTLLSLFHLTLSSEIPVLSHSPFYPFANSSHLLVTHLIIHVSFLTTQNR